ATDTRTAAGSKLGHSFTNYVSDNNATCTSDCTMTAKCDNCDATDMKIVAGSKLSHSFTSYVSDNNATCTSDGTETAKCDNCEATDTHTVAGSKLSHSFANYVSNNDATCIADGTKTGTCEVCGESVTVADPGTKKGHDFENGACKVCGFKMDDVNGDDSVNLGDVTAVVDMLLGRSEVTEAADANGDNIVDISDLTVIIDRLLAKNNAADYCAKHGHQYSEYVSNNDATCKADGTKTAICERCGKENTITDRGSMKEHEYENGVCKNCGSRLGDINGDDVLDINDVNILIGMVFGSIEMNNAADVNGDNVVDYKDVQDLLDIIFGE
ncbi:MAG: dockerin type I domain-containing protein, partial [Bacteroidaceae bacterium]|nr:dockerin type I domain-containing protein [Bacteroidaceae bacterium]